MVTPGRCRCSETRDGAQGTVVLASDGSALNQTRTVPGEVIRSPDELDGADAELRSGCERFDVEQVGSADRDEERA